MNKADIAKNVAEIINSDCLGAFTSKDYDLDVEILSVNAIDGGVELYARAWRNKKPIGFGADGSVEIERFRIFNPPLHVPSIDGEFVKDPAEAIRLTLAHTMNVSGAVGGKVRIGKKGNTTDTFYPSSDDSIYASSTVFATARAASTGTLRGSATTNLTQTTFSSPNYFVERAFVNWDTAALANNATISAVTASFFGSGKNGTSRNYNVYGSTASDTIVAEDFDLVGTTAYSDTAIAQASWSIVAYNDFAFNATGIAAISLTGITKVSLREVDKDVGNVAPVTAADAGFAPVETIGTTTDPKLVVVYTSGYSQAAAGNMTSTGGVSQRSTTRTMGANTMTPTGGVSQRATTKSFSGAMTPTGTLSTIRAHVLSLAGSMTPTGALIRGIGKMLAGSMTPTGALSWLETEAVLLRAKLRDLFLAAQKRLRTGEARDAASGFLLLANGIDYLVLADGTSKIILSSAFTPFLMKSRPRKKLLSSEGRP